MKWSVAVLAAVSGADAMAQAATAAPAPSPMSSMLQGLVGLAVVLLVIFAVAWLLKKVGPRTQANGLVQIVGGASVGPREKVVVVRFDGQTLLLGVAPGHVGLLHAGGPSAEQAPRPESAPNVPSFVDRLRAVRKTA